MFNNTGFITRKRGLGAQGGLAPQPSRSITITPVVANATAVVFNITSNMVDGQPILKFDFTGLDGNVFLDPIAGNIQLDANGSATITKNLNTSISISNQFFALNLRSQSNVFFAKSSNVEIRNVRSDSFSGGTTTTSGGIRYQYYTSTGSFNIVKTPRTDPWIANSILQLEIVGGGGAGAGTNVTPGGGGGQGGQVVTANINIDTIATTTSAIVGAGGLANQPTQAVGAGNATVAFGYTASGGFYGNSTSVFNNVNYMTLRGYYGGNGLDGAVPSTPPVFGMIPGVIPNFYVIGGEGGAGVTSIIDGTGIGGGGGGAARLQGTPDQISTYSSYGGAGRDGGGNGSGGFGQSGGAGTPNTGGGGGGSVFLEAGPGGSGRIAFKYPYKGANYAVFMPN